MTNLPKEVSKLVMCYVKIRINILFKITYSVNRFS